MTLKDTDETSVARTYVQVAPPDVDFRIMLTFLEFYETLLKFTLYKLYHTLELTYPPVLDGRLDECGVYMAAVRGLPLNGASKPSTEVRLAHHNTLYHMPSQLPHS